MHTDNLGAIYSALSDDTRRHIVLRLSRGELTLKEMGVGLDMSKQAVSKHVRVLELAGLIDRRIQGREHYCSLRNESLESAQVWIESCRETWVSNLNKLELHLQNKTANQIDV